LRNAGPVLFSTWAIAASFSTYFCMYAFRKPFAQGTFVGAIELGRLGELDYKIALIISQVLGYCLSKFIGIKVISEASPRRRGTSILVLILFAELALVGLGLAPRPWGMFFLFLNGLPLGMVWGLVFGYLEGRRVSEALGAGLSASYIIASMAVKSVGGWLLLEGISERWMPFFTGLLFTPVLLVSVWALSQLPPPTEADAAARTRRKPMDARARKRFVLAFTPGLLALTGLYVLLTAYRDFRDNFAREIWDAVGYAGKPGVMTYVEIAVAVGVLLSLAAIMRVKDNDRAVTVIHLVMLAGAVLIGVSTWAHDAGWIPPLVWMGCLGLGLYLGYVPFGCVLFDRLIAAVGFVGTAGFMIYVTDAFGYLGSVGLLLYKNFGEPDLSWLDFFRAFSYVTSLVCGSCFVFSMVYFRRRMGRSSEHGGGADEG
jgi:hypothetical protein